ncbi:FAD-dependent monooxygenase [Dactylosporangium sp. McL0621]|uniref:FAD-dependent monooxygenase n=1 Tax=Dactylosporangium sp. McL0621 TaxID=3415678 RepID=UPI003CED3CED
MQHHHPARFGLRVAVVGGSLTGTATALFLAQAGFPHVTVHEAAPAAATLGGGLLSLEHPVLDRLDLAGLPQQHYVHLRSATIWQVPVRNRQAGRPAALHYPGRFTTWTRLAAALTAAATGWLPAGAIRTGDRVTGLTEHQRRPRLHLAGGGTAEADLVVFADGRASTGRALLDPHRRLHYAGYVAHRGTLAGDPLGLHDFWRLQPGAGLQLNSCPVPGGLDWTCYRDTAADRFAELFGAPPHQRVYVPGRRVGDAARAELDEAAARVLPPGHADVVHATADRAAFPVLDIDPPTRAVWPIGDGFAVLTGDALAPVRAHTGRGANHGLEQAAALTAVLRQYARHGADLGTALHGWQRRILPAVHDTLRLGPRLGARAGLGGAVPANREPALAAISIR